MLWIILAAFSPIAYTVDDCRESHKLVILSCVIAMTDYQVGADREWYDGCVYCIKSDKRRQTSINHSPATLTFAVPYTVNLVSTTPPRSRGIMESDPVS